MKYLMVNVLACDSSPDQEDLKKGKTKYRFDYQVSKKIKLRDGTLFDSNEKASAKSLVILKSGPQILEIRQQWSQLIKHYKLKRLR